MEPGHLEFQPMQIPALEAGDILVRVRKALTCGTDVKTYLRGHPKYDPPTLFGHEFAGEVVAIGSNVTAFSPGMRVVAANTAPCNICFFCKRGQHNLCEDLLVNLGAFAEYIRVPERIVRQNTFIIPEHVSDEEAAAMEPLACVLHGQDLLSIQPGESVAIIGAGPIGLMHLQLALHHGASPIYVLDLSDKRLEIAAELGATLVVNPTREKPSQLIQQATGERGVDVSIESAGNLDAWLMAVDIVRKGGRVQWFGGLPSGSEVTLDAVRVHYDELIIYGVYHATPLTFERAFRLITEGVVKIKPLVTGELPLERLEQALKMMMSGECVKMAILP
jgi:L-iditol 2-dehydrogenase